MSASAELRSDSVVAQSPGQLSCQLDGQVVAMCLDGGKYYRMDPVGAAAWELMTAPIRVDRLCERLRERFDVERERCEADVLAFLVDLRRFGLLAMGGDEGLSR